MDKFEKTVSSFTKIKYKTKNSEKYFLTIIEGDTVQTIELEKFGKEIITFGRGEQNDIRLASKLVSDSHGYFMLNTHGLSVVDDGSTNGLFVNGKTQKSTYLSDGSSIRIDNPEIPLEKGVVMIISISEYAEEWKQFDLKNGKNTIGRDKKCDIVLKHIGVSNLHATIYKDGDRYVIEDEKSTNGISVNGQKLYGRKSLKEKDIILITNSKFILTENKLLYQTYKKGMRLEAVDIVKTIKTKHGTKDISSHVNLTVRPGEFVALVGGSGAGKSTFLKAISGVNPPTSGQVLLNGENLYNNYDVLKNVIGYVPQDDIVFSNLTLNDMLKYAAALRMPDDTTIAEKEARIDEVLEIVELTKHKNTYIRQLSGGQRKRASMAVELIADPSLFFLDEPTSGLDPGTERSIMKTLEKMARMGKTIILVTHNTLNLHLCDKVVFLGEGGKLCFVGKPSEALEFFEVDDFVDIYTLLNQNTTRWNKKFNESKYAYTREDSRVEIDKTNRISKTNTSFIRQLIILTGRNIKLIVNDVQQLLLLFLQAPIIAWLVSLVSTDKLYRNYDDTKAILFALACASIWLGLLNSIQEICREKVILQKEYMANLKISAYLSSKFLVQAMLAFIQSTLVVGIFQLFSGAAETSLLVNGFWDIQIVSFMTILASAALGLFISAVVKNSNSAMAIVPLILVPQLLFSGMLFELKGITKFISNFIICRWSVEGLGSSVDLNNLTHFIQIVNPLATVEAEDYFIHTVGHMQSVIMILGVMTVAVMIGSYMYLRKNVNKSI